MREAGVERIKDAIIGAYRQQCSNTPIPTPIPTVTNTPVIAGVSNTIIETIETHRCSSGWCTKISRNGIIISDTPIQCRSSRSCVCSAGTNNQCYSITNRTVEVTSTPTIVETSNPSVSSDQLNVVESKRPKQVTTSDIITFVTPTSAPINEEQNQEETRISWLESIIKSTLDFIKSIF